MSNKTGNTIVAILVGTAIGAGLGILFAPDKGSKTREKIKDGLDDVKHDFKVKYNDVSDKLLNKVLIAKDDIDGNYENIVSTLSYKTEDVISFLENKLAELKLKNAKFQK
ncbi:GvpP Gas vesicle protein [Flavobacteriaceae bacterium]|jgi:gas vesicle protein